MDGGVSGVPGAGGRLVGRDGDLRVVRERLRLGAGGGALLLAGEAGVGKSAVLDALAGSARADGVQVLRAGGVEFEADCGYSCLNQVLFPFLGALEHLDATLRQALRVALGFAGGSPPEQLLVSNAVLRLLQTVAGGQALLIVVDDLPWVDHASTAVFGFVARRVSGLGVSFVAAARSGESHPYEGSGLPTYDLPPLDDESADRLLGSRFPGLARGARRRLLAEAGGNPLALLELPAALRPASADSPAVLPLSRRLETLFGSRVAGLPAPSRHLLLLAALEGTGDLGVLQAAARRAATGYDLDHLAPVERDRLVHIEEGGQQLRFRHPLIRSAVVGQALSGERRAAHAALAHVLVDQPERRAWHLGEATLEPDEEVAALLEHAAGLTLRRGDAAGAMRTLIRSASLSPEGPNRSRRLAEAAYLGAESTGALSSARRLLDDARQAAPEGEGSLHSATASALILLNGDDDVATAHRLLSGAIESAAGAHRYRAGDKALVDALHVLAVICFFGARHDLWQFYYRVVERLTPEPPAILAVLGRTFSDPARSGAAAHGQLDVLMASLAGEADPVRITRVGTGALYLDRLGEVREAAWQVVRAGRDGGPARRYISALIHLCLDDYLTGRWDEALDLADEGLRACEEHGYSAFAWYFQYIRSIVLGARGHTDESLATAERIIDWATRHGAHCAAHYAYHAAAVAALGCGDFALAYEQTNAVSPAGTLASHVPHALWVAADLVEAGARSNRRKEAAEHVRAMRDAGITAVSSRHAMLMEAAAAQCADDDQEALRLFALALATPEGDRWRFDHARVQLACGERMRRARATTASRTQLRAALATFEDLGARPWAARAENELRATGWSRPRPEASDTHGLTAQKLQIAHLAASGLTNKQIAERLFLSHRTVGAHLYQIYEKLGITSRAMLRDALNAEAEPTSRPAPPRQSG
ncbi:LuxR family transcriptional regulator [Streptomyces sp. WAC01526]|uniref:LuxR family transcriptional regulator n=1 Tax=Streptomyces sp. WAC01526 TaxID=2588709 RepID=UPI0011DFB4AE|nr:LuxR family transcriptional regulator [Streptomyces sp. WAC01526]